MNINEFKEAMTSDAMKERDRLKTENNELRRKYNQENARLREAKENLIADCKALSNRCFTLTKGLMCCFCDLTVFRCDHEMSLDEKVVFAKELRKEVEKEYD